ncbi:hypothetical protein [Carboxylicivirga marina]|uniref:Uncharacterized protein n=1 Tax=Carboxylicivirga marina TaxID=2800988 RepID=A0ABS1HFB0_9BACT|nr:hypothetical protein [Carboxylicivirga marina]MBK3516333.1 hypothetical protein [Carboxylicivirga marina]
MKKIFNQPNPYKWGFLARHTIDETDYEANSPILFYLKVGQVYDCDITQILNGYVMIFKEAFMDEFNDVAQLLARIPINMHLSKHHKNLFSDFELMMNEFELPIPIYGF